MSDSPTCPESTIESANRRNFIRKAALTTAAVGVGSSILSGVSENVLPQSSGKSACCVAYANVWTWGCLIVDANCLNYGLNCNKSYGKAGTISFGHPYVCSHCCPTCISGEQISSARRGCTNWHGLDFYTDYQKRMSITITGCVGIGTYEPSSKLEVKGSFLAAAPDSLYIPIVARRCFPSSICAPNLQEWQNCAGKPMSVVNKCGWIGIGTCNPTSTLSVVGNMSATGSLCAQGITSLKGIVGNCPTGEGVFGFSPSGAGVCGTSCGSGGIGVRGTACGPGAIPIVAKGCSSQTANLQQWEKGSTVLDVVNKCGFLGIGTSTPSTPLDVIGASPLVGTIKSKASSGDRSSLVQFANGDTTAVDWNVGVAGLCNSIKVPDGYFYLQHSTSTTPAISVNKCNNHVGIGLANPCRVLCVNGRIHTSCGMGLGTQTINTTLAVNGSFSVKSRQVSSTTTLSLSDYVVLANASSAAFTITLPAVSSTAGACNGMMLFIKKMDSSSNAVTIAASGTDTIEGNASVVLKKRYDSLQLVSNNSSGTHEWFILAAAKCGAFVS
jgi:hypothetical protein